jgi:ferredoxin-NADP reductase
MTLSSTSVWRPARVIENRPVANGSMWIKLEATDKLPAAFEPGHVLGLGVPVDQGHIRHAYTISRADPESRQFEHLYRVIPGGRMTPHLAALPAGSAMFFHGPFHTPIQKEIRAAAERIVLIATGTGIGPVFGYAEKALNEGESRPMTLYAGFHVESDMCLVGELEALAREHSNFSWQFTVSHPSELWRGLTGRVTDCVPARIHSEELEICHFHLVGNGEMVHVMRKALHLAGVAPERVSIETYFNHYTQPSDDEVHRLAARFLSNGDRQ